MESVIKKVMMTLLLTLGIAGCLQKPGPRTGDFNAVVLDYLTEEPVAGVEVSIEGGQVFTTDHQGLFSLAQLSPGEYRMRMTREWYEPKTVIYRHLGKPELVAFYLKPPSLPGRIYYSYDERGDKEIYALNLEDRSLEKVLKLPGSAETDPAWSKSRLAVESTVAGVSKIHIYDITKGYPEPVMIQDSFFGEHPSLDADGEKMAYKSGKIIKYDLRTNTEIESYDRAGWNPVISPDGGKVAYVSGDYTKLYIYSGKYEFKEFSYIGFKFNNPCWSPDGSKIAFEAYENSEGKRAIYYIAVNSESFTMKQLTFPNGEKEQHKHPTWGENDLIYFSGNIIYSSRNDIYAVEFKEGELNSNPWIMVSKGSGNKLYPYWGK